MKDKFAKRLAALIHGQLDRNRLNAGSKQAEDGTTISSYDENHSEVNMTEVVQQLDDESRQKLAQAIQKAQLDAAPSQQPEAATIHEAAPSQA